ncbi:hypothetical protein HMPREF0027_0342 [Actinobacillus ureae ATCC 25976]|uniref:Uncharacterized protein n=1 Tax=Actinobacillus ureae ATCC 25976 TaxID=887324 RepID=E8KES5_9PAST|nr:hypothetical protein HMPREF0027_0342 [Actinobacillus ureae ATCC 25976]
MALPSSKYIWRSIESEKIEMREKLRTKVLSRRAKKQKIEFSLQN